MFYFSSILLFRGIVRLLRCQCPISCLHLKEHWQRHLNCFGIDILTTCLHNYLKCHQTLSHILPDFTVVCERTMLSSFAMRKFHYRLQKDNLIIVYKMTFQLSYTRLGWDIHCLYTPYINGISFQCIHISPKQCQIFWIL